MKVRLERLQSTNDNLRTSYVVGDAEALPQMGSPFVMTAAPLRRDFDVRLICTSPVVSVLEAADGTVAFITANSRYRLVRELEN